MPLSVSLAYSRNPGKNGEYLSKLFTDHKKILQMCGTFTKLAKCVDFIIIDSSLCSLYCGPYFTSDIIWQQMQRNCSFCPRSCTKYLSLKQQCIRRAFFCCYKELRGRKQKKYFIKKQKIKAETIDCSLSLIPSSRLPAEPDSSRLKNWMLDLIDERGISFLSPHPSEQIRRQRNTNCK